MLNNAKAMMVDSNLPYEMRYALFQEEIMTAAELYGIVIFIICEEAKTRYEH